MHSLRDERRLRSTMVLCHIALHSESLDQRHYHCYCQQSYNRAAARAFLRRFMNILWAMVAIFCLPITSCSLMVFVLHMLSLEALLMCFERHLSCQTWCAFCCSWSSRFCWCWRCPLVSSERMLIDRGAGCCS